MLLQTDNSSSQENSKETKPVNDFITDFLTNPNKKEANTQRLTMWYRLLAYENKLFRLFMILGVLPFDINHHLIKNHQILKILKPFILEKFDSKKIIDLKQCFDRGLNSFFICLLKYGKFEVHLDKISFVEGAPGQVIKDNLDPFSESHKTDEITQAQQNTNINGNAYFNSTAIDSNNGANASKDNNAKNANNPIKNNSNNNNLNPKSNVDSKAQQNPNNQKKSLFPSLSGIVNAVKGVFGISTAPIPTTPSPVTSLNVPK